MFLAAGVFVGAAVAQHAGDIPPALIWDKLKGSCPANLEWSSLHGKVVVVAFPSAFTFPDEIPEWNNLPKKFHGEPVVFIQVASGSEFLLDQALTKTPYQGCVLFDGQQANRRNFFQGGLARTLVVDAQGWIAGYARGDVNEAGVRSVLTHQTAADLADTPTEPERTDPMVRPSASYDVHISPAAEGEWRALGSIGLDGYSAKNQSLKSIITDLWETPPSRIVFPDDLDEARYDVTARIPVNDGDVLMELVRNAILRRFGLNVRKESRTQRVYLLTAAQSASQLRPAKDTESPMSGSSQRSMIGTARTMQDIASTFEDLLQTPVIDQTTLQGRYDYSATSEVPRPGSAFEMARQLGLQLVETERPVEILVVRKF